MSEKTPTPWRTGGTAGGRLGIWSHGCRADEPDVCDVAAVPRAADYARAARIVLAVNAHDVMVAALKDLLAHVEEEDGIEGSARVRRAAFAVAMAEGRA